MTYHGILLEFVKKQIQNRWENHAFKKQSKTRFSSTTAGAVGKGRCKAVPKWHSVHHVVYYEELCKRGYSLYARLCNRRKRQAKGNPV